MRGLGPASKPHVLDGPGNAGRSLEADRGDTPACPPQGNGQTVRLAPRLTYSRFKPVSLLKKCTVLPLNENETASPVLTMPACSMSEAACATITLS